MENLKTNNVFVRDIVENNKNPTKGIRSYNYCKDYYDRINGIQKETLFVYGASSKTGKTTFVDYIHILVPYLEGYRFKIIYYAWEISLKNKMRDFCSFFLNHKYNIKLSSREIEGTVRQLTQYEIDCITDIYDNELKDLFGTFNDEYEQVDEGMIDYIEDRCNHQQFEDYLMEEAVKYGQFTTTASGKKYFKWYDNSKHVHIIIDHIGKVTGGSKADIDLISDSIVRLRNLLRFTFIVISQFNRGLTAFERRGQMTDQIRPEKTDFKGTSNLSEDCNFLIALFNPTLLAELDSIKIDGKRYQIRKQGALLDGMYAFRCVYLLESREVAETFELPFKLGTKSIEFL